MKIFDRNHRAGQIEGAARVGDKVREQTMAVHQQPSLPRRRIIRPDVRCHPLHPRPGLVRMPLLLCRHPARRCPHDAQVQRGEDLENLGRDLLLSFVLVLTIFSHRHGT